MLRENTTKNAYEIITDLIISKLEQGIIPWRCPWRRDVNGKMLLAQNLLTGETYSGVNQILLNSFGFEKPFFVTLKQCQELKGSVKNNAIGYPIFFFGKHKKDKKKENGETEKEEYGFWKYYIVYNILDCENLKLKPEMLNKVYAPENHFRVNKINKLAECEALLKKYKDKPEIRHREARAYYSPSFDFVNMPKMELFNKSEEYYSTLFHELVHSTGHKDRLNRWSEESYNHTFGSSDYSKEELIAEMGSAFMCAIVNIQNKVIDNQAAYIRSWLRSLKNDKTMILKSAKQAQNACEYMQDVKRELKQKQIELFETRAAA